MKSKMKNGLYRIAAAAGIAAVIFNWSCAAYKTGERSVEPSAVFSGESAEESADRTSQTSVDLIVYTRLRILEEEIAELMDMQTDDNEVRRVYDLASGYLKDGSILLSIFYEEDNPETDAAYFRFTVDRDSRPEQTELFFSGERLIEYEQNRAFLLCSFVNELKNIYDLYTQTETYISKRNNALEMYLYEMDAFRIEALFVRDFLIPGGITLGSFEQLLLESYDEDNLATISLFFKRTDMNLVYYMNRQVKAFDQDKISLEKYLQLMENLGNDILSQAKYDTENDTVLSAIAAFSYDYYIPYIINRIWICTSEQEDEKLLMEYSGRINKLKEKMQKIYADNERTVNDFYIRIKEDYGL